MATRATLYAHLWIRPVHCASAHGQHETRIGHADKTWPDGYAKFMRAEQEGGVAVPIARIGGCVEMVVM
jgi:hypothetical protein